MQDNVAIIRRGERAVISRAIRTPRGPGWHCASNWQQLEGLARLVIANARTNGPFIYPCPPQIAALASFADLPIPTGGQRVQATFGMEANA